MGLKFHKPTIRYAHGGLQVNSTVRRVLRDQATQRRRLPQTLATIQNRTRIASCFSDYGCLVFRQTIQPNGHALCIEFNITGEYLGNLICGQLAAEHLRLHDDVVAQGFF